MQLEIEIVIAIISTHINNLMCRNFRENISKSRKLSIFQCWFAKSWFQSWIFGKPTHIIGSFIRFSVWFNRCQISDHDGDMYCFFFLIGQCSLILLRNLTNQKIISVIIKSYAFEVVIIFCKFMRSNYKISFRYMNQNKLFKN